MQNEELELPSPPSSLPNLSSSSENSLSDNVDSLADSEPNQRQQRPPAAQRDDYSNTSRHSSLSRSRSYLYSSASANIPSSTCDTDDTLLIWPLKEYLSVEQEEYKEGAQWHVLAKLGEGAFGSCHLAKDKNSEKDFCVKKCKYRHNEVLPMFLAAKEKIPEIVEFYGAVINGRNVCIFMEVLGDSVRDIVKGSGKGLVSATAFSYLQDVMKALLFIHGKGIVHNDVKGANVLITINTVQAKLIDFGSATSVQDSSCRGDIWRSGCLLIEMLTAKISPLYNMNPRSIKLQEHVSHVNIGEQELKVMESCFHDEATEDSVLNVAESARSQCLKSEKT